MATRGLQFFIRPDEFSVAIWAAAEKYQLAVILRRIMKNPFVEVTPQSGSLVMSDGAVADEVIIASETPESWMLRTTKGMNYAAWGWVNCQVPYEADNNLFIVQLGAKSTWWDSEQRTLLENPTSLVVFKKVAAILKKLLRRPVWVRSTRISGRAQLTRDVWYSEGAKEWVAQGGQLRQPGRYWNEPGYVEFLIEPPANSDT